jgi:hypothetical protein
LDKNGIYISVLHLAIAPNTIVAIKKPEIYQGTLQTNILTNVVLASQIIQPAVNFDDPPVGGYAWFVSKGANEGIGSNYQGGAILYRRLHWTNSTAVWADTNWQTLHDTLSGKAYRNYLDLDTTGSTGFAPHLGATNQTNYLDLTWQGSRLMMATVQNGFLYTCQHVGRDGTDGDYGGDETATTFDRTAIQWFKLRTPTNTAPLSCYARGRILDSSATNPRFYYMPSLAVNCAGDVALGFSGSKANEYIGAYYAWRPGSGPQADIPI